MSGGSFNYLYCNPPEPSEDLERMAREARREGFKVGADALDSLIAAFDALHQDWAAAEDFMQAFEWWQSCDWSPGRVAAAERKIHAAQSPVERERRG